VAKKTKRTAKTRTASKAGKKAKGVSRRGASAKSKPAKKVIKKPIPKPATKAAKTAGSKSAVKTAVAKKANAAASKPSAKSAANPATKPVAKPAPKAKPEVEPKKVAPAVETKPVEPAKSGPSSTDKSPRKPKVKPPPLTMPDLGAGILGPGSPKRKPLIPSGPSAVKSAHLQERDAAVERKSPLSREQLDRFREILVQKRIELVGDVSNMEEEALRGGGSGSLSHVPQHMAEQGSEAYDQSLSLDLAAADRRLIKEIDDAIIRIDTGTFGICEYTGKPIRLERLNELPWARYSIEAARELERRRLGP
jgi:RNA polymerase-binding transcription factor DksA